MENHPLSGNPDVGTSLFVIAEQLNAPSETSLSSSDEPQCRICHMSEGALIAPCLCRGSAKYAHTSCLQRWLRVKSARAPGDERWIITCQVCQSHFRLRIAYKREGKRNFNKCHIFEMISLLGWLLWVFFYSLSAPFVLWAGLLEYRSTRASWIL